MKQIAILSTVFVCVLIIISIIFYSFYSSTANEIDNLKNEISNYKSIFEDINSQISGLNSTIDSLNTEINDLNQENAFQATPHCDVGLSFQGPEPYYLNIKILGELDRTDVLWDYITVTIIEQDTDTELRFTNDYWKPEGTLSIGDEFQIFSYNIEPDWKPDRLYQIIFTYSPTGGTITSLMVRHPI